MKIGRMLCGSFAALALSLGLWAAPAAAEERVGFIHAVDAANWSIQVGDLGATPSALKVSEQSTISGPMGPMALGDLPSLAAGEGENHAHASWEEVSGVLLWIRLNEPLDGE